MLQLVHLSVAKLDLDVGLLSEEERASAGAMTASMWGAGTGHAAGVEEAGAKRCVRGGRGASVEETGPSHPDGVCSGAEGSGLNVGAGNA